jgi:SagB-type dehydrogenase family enzyme
MSGPSGWGFTDVNEHFGSAATADCLHYGRSPVARMQAEGLNLIMRLPVLLLLLVCLVCPDATMAQSSDTVALPRPARTGETSLERLLAERRSVREYSDAPLTLAELGQLLWAAQGVTHPRGLRTAPSAGALYPLKLYVVAGDVQGLSSGTYHYQPGEHRLRKIAAGDGRKGLAAATLSQTWVREAPVAVVFAAVYARTTQKYGRRGRRYVHMEVGHAAQNLFLQAGALGLATVVVGAFEDEQVARLLQLPAEVQPLVLMPVGRQ